MGQKVNPISFRIGINQTWRSRWYADKKHFGALLISDQRIRRHIQKHYAFAGIPRIDIERTGGEARITLHCARPGVIIGRKGQEVERLRAELESIAGCAIHIDIREISKPEADATLIAQAIAEQLQKRSSSRRATRKAAEAAMQLGCLGVKIELAGRIAGAEMRRRERVVLGRIPLHTLDSIIDYGQAVCITNFGCIGIKVWVYHGETPAKVKHAPQLAPAPATPAEGAA